MRMVEKTHRCMSSESKLRVRDKNEDLEKPKGKKIRKYESEQMEEWW